ncbi:MAG: glycosyltransferase family 2 protein [Gammaproteobacteria bacterium]
MDTLANTGLANHLSTRSNLIHCEASQVIAESGSSRQKQGGLRMRGYCKQSSDDKPLITVITVVLNSAVTIEETIRSVLFQSYDNVEYILIDGGSSDGTREIISTYDDYIDYWVSGPDDGIYSAMNKGISLASGQYINFLNADDHYLHSGVLEKIIGLFRSSGSQIIIGDVLMLSKQTGSGYIRHCDVNKYYYLFRGLPQQAFFYDARLFDAGAFDESFSIAADLDFYLSKLLGGDVKITSANWPVIVFNTGAASSNQELLLKERSVVIKKHYTWMERLLFRNRLFWSFFVNNELRAGKPGIVDRIFRRFSA